MDRHKLTHETKRNFDCDVCGKKFKFKHYLVSHKLLHSGDKPHMCTWCGMTFTQNANMQKHVRMKHTNNKGHVCSYCGKSFVQAYYLRRHLATHREAGLEKATLAALVETHTSSDEQVTGGSYSTLSHSRWASEPWPADSAASPARARLNWWITWGGNT